MRGASNPPPPLYKAYPDGCTYHYGESEGQFCKTPRTDQHVLPLWTVALPCFRSPLGPSMDWRSTKKNPPTPPPLELPHPLSFPRGGWGTVTCSTQNFSLQLTVLLLQNHYPRVLPKAFQRKVVSMCKSSRSSGAGPRKCTPSWSRSRSPYISSPLNVSYAEVFCFRLQFLQFLCLQMCVYGSSAVPQGGVGDRLPWGGEGQGGGV